VVEIGQALERRLRIGRQRRLRVCSKELIATLPKPLQRIRPFQTVKVADTPAPIGEVDVVLGPAVSQCFLA
jgi:hypothetical protein